MARRRSAHGNAAKLGAETVWESTPSDEVRALPPGSAAPHGAREDGRFTSESAREAARKRWALERMPDFSDGTAPWMPPSEELKPFDDARQDLLLQRWSELTVTGSVGSGVGAKLRGWAAMHAGAEYWQAVFFSTGNPEAYDRMVRGFKAASTAEDQARDAAAWEAQARGEDDGAELRRKQAEFQRNLAARQKGST